MRYRFVADVLVVLHVAFVAFVVVGGFLALRWRRLAWLHLPAAVWGAIIEFMGWVCPLTPLENHFRRLAGEGGYQGGFIEHYVIPAASGRGRRLPGRLHRALCDPGAVPRRLHARVAHHAGRARGRPECPCLLAILQTPSMKTVVRSPFSVGPGKRPAHTDNGQQITDNAS
ncbi:MAG: DUF2784 domain-containing protein [Gemmatimonadetes bacterium]|nr:DUF2784 domain-containing protein [Gemmatimonadota bacterium]